MAKGYVISDLHMMAAYSQADKYWPAIERAAKKADFFILNGDLNEMYFASLPFERRMEAAIGNIERFAKANPQCQFHYIMGNHENIDAYLNAMVTLSHRLPNLHIHPSLFRMKNALFLHGDEPLGNGEITHNRHFHPAKGAKQSTASAMTLLVNPVQATYRDLRHMVYYSFNRDVGRVLNALEGAEPNIRDGVEHVFFAHTHRPKFAVSPKQSNIKFYNTGAGVRGARFSLLEIETDGNDRVLNVHDIPVDRGASFTEKEDGRHDNVGGLAL